MTVLTGSCLTCGKVASFQDRAEQDRWVDEHPCAPPKRRFMPFMPKFHRLIPTGQKTATTRSEAYGKPGDLLDTPVGVIRLLDVRAATLGWVRDYYWREEGCDGPKDFEDIWSTIHPRAGFREEAVKVLHVFEYVGRSA